VRSVGRRSTEIVFLAGMDVCESNPSCPLVGGGCVRLFREMEVGDAWPALHAVLMSSILRLEHVVPALEQIPRDSGMTATHMSVPYTADHRRAARFFVNPFYPWQKTALLSSSLQIPLVHRTRGVQAGVGATQKHG